MALKRKKEEGMGTGGPCSPRDNRIRLRIIY
jgi:hypothetical protein